MPRRRLLAILFAAMAIFFGTDLFVLAQDSSTQAAPAQPNGAALVVKGKRLITFYVPLDGLSPEERVERAAIVLRDLSQKSDFTIDELKSVDGTLGQDIIGGGMRIATITDDDAKFANSNPKIIANDFILKLKYAWIQKAAQASASAVAFGVACCIAGFLGLVLLIAVICKLAINVCELAEKLIGSRESGIKIQDAELISARALVDMVQAVVKLLQFAMICVLFSIYAIVALQLFPGTRPLADALIENAKVPLVTLGDSILVYLPNLFTLVMIALTTYGAIFICKFISNALRDGSIRFADFDPEWAEPTYKLARFTVIFFAMVCAFPYLPGWDTPAFKQLGLVVGILISFGSSSAISNIMAGVVLTYTNAFRVGHRVKVADQVGDVLEKNLVVTRLKTPKGEIISIPNAQILSGTITNYSSEALMGRLILHTTVTIGYDVPWRKVHEMLLSAGRKTAGVLSDPEPFVLQTSLDDFYVSYEINVFTDQAHNIPVVYSALHQNIQDAFFENAVEIMSPHFTSLRDGNTPSIPADKLPAGFVSPKFQVENSAQN